MIVVVSDASPVRALDHLGLLPILGKLYWHVLIPPAVQNELQSPPHQLQRVDVSAFEFIEVRAPRDTAQVKRFSDSLHLGESQALALALEVGAAAVLIDEAAARKTAASVGIRPLGTLGILLEAKANGLLSAIRPLIDQLIDELGFFVSGELKLKVLPAAGE